MTPAQLDHLRAIDAHLTALLDLAAKRTPGEWKASRIFADWGFAKVDQIITATHRPETDGLGITLNYGGAVQCIGPKDPRNGQSAADAAFIAACAGRAEAGWLATKAAIERFQYLQVAATEVFGEPQDSIDESLAAILAAWPLELLTLP